MSKDIFILHTEGGIVQNKTPFTKFIRGLKDGKHLLERSNYNKRSNQQNRYLHGVLIPEFRKAMVNCGYDTLKNDVQAKRVLKSMFLKRQLINKETGEVIEYIQDTSDCSKEELNILIDEVIKFAAEEMSYQIPYPNEQTMIEYE